VNENVGVAMGHRFASPFQGSAMTSPVPTAEAVGLSMSGPSGAVGTACRAPTFWGLGRGVAPEGR
jgi:hypothetical protein